MAYLKSSQIKDYIRNRGFESGVMHTLTILAEQDRVQASELRELAQLVDRIADIAGAFGEIAHNMKAVLDRVGTESDDLGLDLNTHTLGDDGEKH